MWITCVWTARDNKIHIGPTRKSHSDIITIYDRWKKKHNVEFKKKIIVVLYLIDTRYWRQAT
jgi:hypothetical protein